jgi:hypothetical protein
MIFFLDNCFVGIELHIKRYSDFLLCWSWFDYRFLTNLPTFFPCETFTFTFRSEPIICSIVYRFRLISPTSSILSLLYPNPNLKTGPVFGGQVTHLSNFWFYASM